MRFALVLFLLIGQFLLPSEALAQLRKIPAVVTDAFKYKYRNAESVEWKDKLTHYLVHFHMEEDRYEAVFKNDGTWVSSQKDITSEDIPKEVVEGLSKSKYADWEVDAYYQIIYPDDHVEYRLLVRKSELNKRDLVFNASGRLLKDKLTL